MAPILPGAERLAIGRNSCSPDSENMLGGEHAAANLAVDGSGLRSCWSGCAFSGPVSVQRGSPVHGSRQRWQHARRRRSGCLLQRRNYDPQTGFRFTLGGSFDNYDVEFIASQFDDWNMRETGVLGNPLVFDETANNPVVVAVPPANTLGYVNSLFDAATSTDELTESERLQAGATYFSEASSRLQDYQINFGSNPNKYLWRFQIGWRHMRLNEDSATGIRARSMPSTPTTLPRRVMRRTTRTTLWRTGDHGCRLRTRIGEWRRLQTRSRSAELSLPTR